MHGVRSEARIDQGGPDDFRRHRERDVLIRQPPRGVFGKPQLANMALRIVECRRHRMPAVQDHRSVGAGLAVAFMADISIASDNMRITDGHIRLGVGAGDHAVIIWPLLCGMAKAKYYLMTADFIDGKEAERIGLVSLCVPADKLMDKAMEVAQKLARGPQQATRFTKRALNNWLRMFGPAFDASLALEMLGFFSDDLHEGVAALKERRAPSFPSTRGK